MTDVIDTTCPKTECCLFFSHHSFLFGSYDHMFRFSHFCKEFRIFPTRSRPKMVTTGRHPSLASGIDAGRTGHLPTACRLVEVVKKRPTFDMKKGKTKKTNLKKECTKKGTCNEPPFFFDGTQSDTNHHESFEIGRFAPSLVLWLINLRTDWFNPGSKCTQ